MLFFCNSNIAKRETSPRLQSTILYNESIRLAEDLLFIIFFFRLSIHLFKLSIYCIISISRRLCFFFGAFCFCSSSLLSVKFLGKDARSLRKFCGSSIYGFFVVAFNSNLNFFYSSLNSFFFFICSFIACLLNSFCGRMSESICSISRLH